MDTLRTHYARLLELDDSWEVADVALSVEEHRVEIRLKSVGGRVRCPECGQSCGIADHAEERRWRHLDTMQFVTELVARLPRCRCPEHGVKTVIPPWAAKHSRFTLLFESLAIEVIQACRTVKAAAKLLRLSWNSVHTIMARAVERGLERRDARAIAHLGIDEKSFGKGQDYVTVLTDIDGSRVVEVAPGRTESAAELVLRSLTDQQRRGVKAIAADMLPAYANAAAKHLPNAELVHDRFHVAKHLGEAVDKVRRAENKALIAADDDRLKGTRQIWLFSKKNLPAKHARRLKAIRQSDLKTARAWAIKEEFNWFWSYTYTESAAAFFRHWYAWGARCQLTPVVKVAKMLKRHLPNLLTYFRHRITNASSEGFNSVIQSLKYAARGFRSFENYRTRILFFCGRLDLKPSTACHGHR
jgi:transposase